MRFIKLELNNWRSFLGSHRLEFAGASPGNVTVVVGQNGAGKTALLNAFTWALFEDTTAGFRQSEDLYNHAALAAIPPGGTGRVEVQLEFEHDGAYYSVKRRQEAHRKDGLERASILPPVLSATRRKDASTEPIGQEDINAVLPRDLHPFFFFPAENIGKDIDQNDAAAIRADMAYAIDVLLGIERYAKASKVISEALSKYLKAPRSGARSAQVIEAEREMNSTRDEWQTKSDRKRLLPNLIKETETIVDGLKIQLDSTTEFRKIIEEYNDIEGQLKNVDERIRAESEEQHRLVNQDCAILFGHEIFAHAAAVLEEAYTNGQIPPKVAAGLLDELLGPRGGKCICGQDIGTHERERLEEIRSRTVEDRVAEFASDLRGRVPRLAWHDETRRDTVAANNFLSHVRAAANAEGERRRLANRMLELRNKQPDIGSHADPRTTMEAWQQTTQKVMNLKTELQALAEVLPRLERRKNEVEQGLQRLLKKDGDARTVGRARELLSNVESALTTIQKSIRAAARQDVERAMNRHYSAALLKNYSISLLQDFRFEIRDQGTGHPVGASSSETALATFAFVGAIAGLMPVYANLDQLLPKGDGKSVGGVEADLSRAYPVVLDSPYSPFGADYSARFSNKLPDLLPQSIIIVREDHLRYVEPMLKAGRVGAAYILRLHTGKEKTRRIKWLGHEVDYIVNTRDEEPPHSKIAALPLE